MITYFQDMSRLEISMTVHQYTRFLSNPKLNHERAVTKFFRCLLDSKYGGFTCNCDVSKGLEFFVDADFVGGWNVDGPLNAENMLSRTGFLVA